MTSPIATKTISWERTIPFLGHSQARALALANEIQEQDRKETQRAIVSGDYSESNATSKEMSDLFQSLAKTGYYREARQIIRGERIT